MCNDLKGDLCQTMSDTCPDYAVEAGEKDWAQAAAASLRENGFCVVKGSPGKYLAPPEICDRCAQASSSQLNEYGRLWQQLDLDPLKEKIMFAEVCARSPACLRYDIALPIMVGSEAMRTHEVLDLDAWVELQTCLDRWARPVLQASGVLAEDSALSKVKAGCDRAGCVNSMPGSTDQFLHRDSIVNSGSTTLVTAFMALVPVDSCNGPTEFKLGSHKSVGCDIFSDCLDFCCEEKTEDSRDPVRPSLGKGDLLLFDYNVKHRGLANCSAQPRPLAYIVYHREGAADKHNFPHVSLRASVRNLSASCSGNRSDDVVDATSSSSTKPPSNSSALDEAVARLQPYILPPMYQRILLGLLQAADEVLTQAGIPYWVCGGVLIGALRHGGFIPHDDDLDIECFEADAPRIRAAFRASSLPATFERSVEQRSSVMGRIIFFDLKTTGTSIDVFLRESPLVESKEFPSQEETFPLQRFNVNGIEVNGPGGNPNGYLLRCYSQEVFSNVKVWNHHVAYLGDVDTEVFVAKSWGLPLALYNAAVAQLGYEPPEVKETAAKTFEHFSREGGEIQTVLWETLGWASPLLPPPDAEF